MKALVIFLTLFLGSYAFAKQHSFMPENELHKFDSSQTVNITEDEFEAALSEVEAFYEPIIRRAHRATLFVVRDWQDPTVNAYAVQYGSTWIVHMYGGMARRPEITVDGFQMVACHEVGHHLAGFPFVQTWAANEGQSDYFAALTCARNLWKDQPEKNADAAFKVPAYPKKACDSAWVTQDERNLCYRVALAGKSLADLLSGGIAKFETPDRSVVSRTNSQHPAGQCRLDTYVAGALCSVEFDENVIPRNERSSALVSCLQSKGQIGFRPRCWFKPTL